MDARELSEHLSRHVDDVVHYLLPDGKRIGREWVTGSCDGEKGKSLKVHLEGHKAGVWADFATNQTGDLLDLWREVRNISLVDAIKEAKEHFGLKDPKFTKSKPKQYLRPPKPEIVSPQTKVMAYLTDSRKLLPATITAYKIAGTPDDTAIIFPFLRDNELIAWKLLKLERKDGKKQTWSSKESEPCLFGWQAIPENSRSVTICEGEIDAMSLYQYGYPALSIPNGAGNHQWIEYEYPNLERFSEIFVCFDMDEPGMKGASEVINRLGMHRCRLVKLYETDANECLQAGYEQEIIDGNFQRAEYQNPQQLKQPSDFNQKVEELFYPVDGVPLGVTLPWSKTHYNIRLRPSELSIWTGINGHGKSLILGQVILSAIKQGGKACIASMEIKPERLLFRMYRQISGHAVPSRNELKDIESWIGGKLWLYNHLGQAKKEDILEVFAYTNRRFGVTHFVIDSLMKLDIREEDFDGQKDFVNKLFAFTHDYSCHLHLVAHSRKGESESQAPGKLDVKGSGTITNIVDNLFSVWRNKKKEEEMVKQNLGFETQEKADCIISCEKQRNGEWEGKIYLWFDKASFQYLESADKKPEKYFSALDNISWINKEDKVNDMR